MVITTYNRVELLRRLFKSIVRQTLAPAEVIVVDDASRDKAAYHSLIQEFRGNIRRLRYLPNPFNRGLSFSRNRGILAAQNPLIALSDDDDEWMPRKLQEQVKAFQRRWDEIDFVYTGVLMKDEKGGILWRWNPSMGGGGLREYLSDISGKLPNVSATLIKRESLLQSGLFDVNLPACEDWDLWIRLIERGCRFHSVRGFLTLLHVQNAGMSRSSTAKKGFILLARKHFRLLAGVRPAVFLQLAWFATGFKLGLRKIAEKFLGVK